MKLAASSLGILLSIAPVLALASGPTPIGKWRVNDTATGKMQYIVSLTESNGVLQGRIDRLAPGMEVDSRCHNCTGVNKNKLLRNLLILSGLRFDGTQWTGGVYTDIATGKNYRANLKQLSYDQLSMHPYIGIQLLGKPQIWKLVSKE